MNKLIIWSRIPAINCLWMAIFGLALCGLPSTTFAVDDATCPNIPERNITEELTYCDDMATICMDVQLANWNSWVIIHNGSPFSGMAMPCDFDTIFSYSYASLPAGGGYELASWTVNGQTYSGSFSDINDLVDLMNQWDPSGKWLLNSGSGVIEGGIPFTNYSEIIIDQPANDTRVNFDLTTRLTPNGTAIQLDTGMHQLVITNLVLFCSDTIDIEVNCLGCEPNNSSVANLELDACDDQQEALLCTNIAPADIANYQLTSDGLPYSATPQGCMNDTTVFYFDLTSVFSYVGTEPFDLDVWTIDGQPFTASKLANFAQLVDSMNVWDVGNTWVLNNKTIEGGDKSKIYGYMQLPIGPNSPEVLNPQPEVVSDQVALPFALGSHELVIEDLSTGCSESITVNVSCVDNCPPFITNYDNRLFSNNCELGAEWCLDIPLSDFVGYQIWVAGQAYTEGLTPCMEVPEAVFYDFDLPSNNGRDPYLLENWTVNGFDYTTTFWTITELVDSMNVWDATGNWVFDASNNRATSDNLENVYTGMTFSVVGAGLSFAPLEEQLGASSTRLMLPVGWNEVVIEQSLTACRDTVYVLVDCDSKGVLEVDLPLGDTDTLCLSLDDLYGDDIMRFENMCDQSSGEYAIIDLQQDDNYCLVFEALDVGMDSACIIICDDLAVCDTTYVYINVTDSNNNIAPIAVTDAQVTVEGMPIVIDLLDNDQVGDGIDTIYLVGGQPENGFVVLSDAGILSFTPNEDYCNSSAEEQITYAICNSAGCDSTIVTIIVNCSELHAFNGFSPNNDDVNDYFIIQGLESHPSNSLTVFNRWGNQVFFANNYTNEEEKAWDGTLNGQAVPDGTYFYILEGEDGVIDSGYVQLNR
ncbi:MAG: gliding motility-associated C-terminal domain-containing protein [Bacteroidota bacterium]